VGARPAVVAAEPASQQQLATPAAVDPEELRAIAREARALAGDAQTPDLPRDLPNVTVYAAPTAAAPSTVVARLPSSSIGEVVVGILAMTMRPRFSRWMVPAQVRRHEIRRVMHEMVGPAFWGAGFDID
jgi:hypothetical protein